VGAETLPAAGGRRARTEARRRRTASRARRHRAFSLEAAQGAGVRVSGGWCQGQREMQECTRVCWAGPYQMGRYVLAHVLNIR
jgi:hypothetical protein